MRQSGSSIVEVIIMMVIMSMSIVGVYSMVNSAQKLAKNTDDQLIATNLAKEWIESIAALRDTFVLRAHDTKKCFFTIDGSNFDINKCYLDNKISRANYILLDNKTLRASSDTAPIPVCINEFGWYSQEWSKTGTDCKSAEMCGQGKQKSCRTWFTRNIVFEACGPETLNQCVKARALITWWKKNAGGTAKTEQLALEQIFTRH
jgi:Tfp pilus assembly protein PilV